MTETLFKRSYFMLVQRRKYMKAKTCPICTLYLNICIPEFPTEPKSFVDELLLCRDYVYLCLSRAYLCSSSRSICLQNWENPLNANADPNTRHFSTFGIKHADEVIIPTATSHAPEWYTVLIAGFSVLIKQHKTIQFPKITRQAYNIHCH